MIGTTPKPAFGCRLAGALLLLALWACGGESPGTGLDSYLRVQGGQYLPGELGREPRAENPTVHSVTTGNNQLYPGAMGKSLGGTVGPGSYAVVVGLVGDAGHWLVPVGFPDDNAAGDFTFSMKVGFSPALPPGPVELILRAAARDGTLGPARTQTLALAQQQDLRPLVISLTWDTEADLDLRVLAPAGNGGAPVEIGPAKSSNLNPAKPGDPAPTQAQIDGAGRLDFDSNAQCVIDGNRRETVAWTQTPPAGHYDVRVDTFSLCGEAAARWHLVVTVGTQVLVDRTGQSGDTDTRFSHGAGAGLAVASFDLNR